MPSFDVVSQIARHELENAVQQTIKEVGQRFDFRDTHTEFEQNQEGIAIRSSSEGRLEAAYKVLAEKVVKRGLSLKVLDPQKVEPAASGHVKQLVKLKEGIGKEDARSIIDLIKESKLKVQASINGDQVRVSGKKRDDLQQAIALLKSKEHKVPLQYINFRD